MRSAKPVSTLIVAGLALGCIGSFGTYEARLAPSFLVAENDAQSVPGTEESTEDSAKMGEEEGTHTGSTMGATRENDTDKIDQPARSNPTTGAEGGAMGDADTPGQ